MTLEFQNTLEDFKVFIRDSLKRRIWVAISLSLYISIVLVLFQSKKNFYGTQFLITESAVLLVPALLYYFIPYWRSVFHIRQRIAAEPGLVGKKKIVLAEEGILYESPYKNGIWRWETIGHINTVGAAVIIHLMDKNVILIPRRSFSDDNELRNFIGEIYKAQNRQREINPISDSSRTIPAKGKPPYALGILGIIPFLGALAGVVLIVFGIKFKDKWFALLGIAGILFTVFFWFKISEIAGTFAPVNRNAWEEISQTELNELVKSIEFYKVKNGVYPDSLKQLQDEDKLAPINDALRSGKGKETYYKYENLGDKYLLFSSGKNGIPGDSDDLYPQIPVSPGQKLGFIRK